MFHARSTKTILIATLASALAFAVLAAQASAIVVPPSATYPAQMCQSNSSSVLLNLASINNTSSSTQTLQCPIPNTWSGRIGAATVKVVDRNPSTNVSCTIYVLDNTHVGGFGWWQTRSTSGSPNEVQELTYGSIGPDTANHYFNMQCSIPGVSSGLQSFLKSYWIFEN